MKLSDVMDSMPSTLTSKMVYIQKKKCFSKNIHWPLTPHAQTEYTQRMAFLNSLKQDVQKPLVRMKDFYYTQNKAFAAQTKANLKALKNQQNEFAKLKTKYTKIVSGDNSKKKQQLLMVKKRFTQQLIYLCYSVCDPTQLILCAQP